ncbi:DUF1822 family protein [Tolypothrix campylonemoides VB511288]|nr:DUF1822 family protein [Tolypothrix campylonemoides VB511288]
MDLIATLILIPFLVGIVTNRVDAMVVAPIVENALKRLQQDSKRENQDLEKILKICFLSALQNIAWESHKELMGSSIVQRYRGIIIYQSEHREELQWLDRKLQQLVKELKQVKQAEYVEMLFDSWDEIASLLTPKGQLVQEVIQAAEEKLIAEALKEDDIPECYVAKVKQILFEKVQEQLSLEIKHNAVLQNLIETNLLAHINANLTKQKLKIKDLENSVQSSKNLQLQQSSEARRRIKLEFDVEKLDAARLEAIVQHLQKLLDDGSITLRRIEEGCMELIFDGSQKGLEKLDALLKSGQLTDIHGISVKDVQGVDSDVSLHQRVVNLSQWLQNGIDTGWQTVEEVLGIQRANLIFAARSAPPSVGVVRAKQINLGIQPNTQLVDLIVDVIPETNQEIGISLQVHPIDNQIYLPQGLKCSVLDTSGEVVLESQARNADNWIQLDIGVEPGDQFTIKITLENALVTQNFTV